MNDLRSAIRSTTKGRTGRRDFLKTPLAGLVIMVGLPGTGYAADEPAKFGGDGMPNGIRDNPKLFVQIAQDGIVSVICTRSEMGTGVRTTIPRIVADELDADMKRTRVVQALGDEIKYGNQDTDGSRSIRHWFMPLRRAGAAARMMLEQAAANEWKVPVDQVQAVNHEVVDKKTGKKLGFGALALAAYRLDVPTGAAIKLKDPSKFRYIGKEDSTLLDGPDIATGKTHFGQDTRLPGMLYAVMARPPVLGGKVKSVDSSAAMKVPGVLKVFQMDGTPPPSEFQPIGGVVVVAKDTWAAIQGRKALKIEWQDMPEHASYDSVAFRTEMEAAVKKTGGKVTREEGDAYAALQGAAKRVQADYYVPHLAHACMEPPASTARFNKDGSLDIWACTQSPQAAKERLGKRYNLAPDKVTVNVTLLGGGFGRKSKCDFVIESAIAAKEMGAPVKMVWTREDDLHHDYFHTVTAQHLEAGIDANGKVNAWLHRAAEPTLFALFMPDPKTLHTLELGLGLNGMPYSIPNVRIENPEAAAHARVGWLRSVNNIQHAFAAQSFIAEIAQEQKRDHREFLLELLGPDRKIDPRKISENWNHGENPDLYPIDTARLRAVIERVTKEVNWKDRSKMPKGQGLGLAAHYSFVSYMAAVVEVAVSPDGDLVIPRVDIAIDCGAQINPDRVRSQLEGGCVMGLSQALMSEITFKNGRVQQDNFDSFELVRMRQAPKEVRVHFVSSQDYSKPLGGVGEPSVPVIAPALMNAINAATGKRIRKLPLRDQLQAPV